MLRNFPRRKTKINIGKDLRPLLPCKWGVCLNAFHLRLFFVLCGIILYDALFLMYNEAFCISSYTLALLTYSSYWTCSREMITKQQYALGFVCLFPWIGFLSSLFLLVQFRPQRPQYYVMNSREGTWTYFVTFGIIPL